MARSAREIWETALGQLQIQVTRVNYDTWLKDTTGVTFEDDLFVVGAATAFACEWLEKRMQTMIRNALGNVLGHTVHVRFVVNQVADDYVGSAPLGGYQQTDYFSGDGFAQSGSSTPRLNPRYTFDSFVVGSSNRLPHAAAVSVADRPGQSYNPLFIYGGVGLGKTHLLHAIGNVAIQRGATLLYCSSEQFTNEFINAIREHRNEEFRQKYRSVDMLLIDDIQFIAGKEQTQEEFFHTFNDLHSGNRQIVISSDRPPKSMPLLEDRLRSRFEWGLLADVQPPDYETRLAILTNKARRHAELVPPEVTDYIAQKVQTNIRELEGCLNRVIAYANLNDMPLSVEVAEEVLSDLSADGGRRRSVPPSEIVDAVAEFYRIDTETLEGKRRDRETATARQVAMYLLREETQLSLSEIGAVLGNRDHTTVMHGHNKIAAGINISSALRREIQQLREALRTASQANTG